MAVVAVAGCTTRHHTTPPDPDAAAVAAARAGELQLLSSVAAGTPAYDAHLAHLHALGGRLPSPGSPPPGATPAYADLAGSVPALQGAAVAAHNGEIAAQLASVAASHAVLAGQRR